MTDLEDRALALVDAVWEEVRQSPYFAREELLAGGRLPDLTEEAAVARSARAQHLLDALDALDALDSARLPRELALTVEVARHQAATRAQDGRWYWLAFDPLGIGFYALYAPTAYGGGFLMDHLTGVLRRHAFTTPADVAHYLDLVDDLGRLVRQLDARTRGQAERDVRLPLAQLQQAVTLVGRLRDAALDTLTPSAERLPDAGLRAEVEARIAAQLVPAYDDALAWLSDPARAAEAPREVGLGSLPGGAELYAELVRLHTTLDVTPQELHERGLTRMAEVEEQMRQLADGSPREHLAAIGDDPAWRAADARELTSAFERYLERIRPRLGEAFRLVPRAGYGVAPLPDALAASMTYGYYAQPSPAEPTGRYLFNTANLCAGDLSRLACLTYHELVPGHHFHLALQGEDETLHPLRRHSLVTAFNEGWAEYAAHVAGELGMYAAPEEQFGKLVMEAFLTARLVADTGMNALGWDLEQGRAYLRDHGLLPEAEVLSESLRYACDLPGQALAYKAGDLFLQGLRARVAERLGAGFDLRDFHDAVLGAGALPLRLVERNVEQQLR